MADTTADANRREVRVRVINTNSDFFDKEGRTVPMPSSWYDHRRRCEVAVQVHGDKSPPMAFDWSELVVLDG